MITASPVLNTVPSPRFQLYVSVSPSGSDEPSPRIANAMSVVPVYGPSIIAIGALFAFVITMFALAVLELSAPSCTTSVMV